MMFDTNNVPSVEDWFNILNWEKLPNFGNFHSNTSLNDFKNHYYQDKEVTKLYKNIFQTLRSSNGKSANIRLSGDPGAGKTSFLYAIKLMSEAGKDILRNYFFYIFHINKAVDDDTKKHYLSEVQYHIIKAWGRYYSISGQDEAFDRLRNQKVSKKCLINKLTEYYKENRDKFKKTMVFVVDDVDLLPGESVEEIVDIVLQNIEVAGVKKWLVIRKKTFANYRGATKTRIEEFFPDPYEFPGISLQDLVCYRIGSIGSIGSSTKIQKNPFSKELCDNVIMKLCDGNLREGLSLLKTIIEDNLPGKFKKSTAESVIQNYIEKSSVRSLVATQKLVNLHENIFKVVNFPLAIDILACSKFNRSKHIIYGSLNDCSNLRNKLCNYPIGTPDDEYKVANSDFDHILNLLIEHDLLKKDGNNRFIITTKGSVISSFSLRSHYYKQCKEVSGLIMDDEVYWKLAEKNIDHENIVSLFSLWTRQRA